MRRFFLILLISFFSLTQSQFVFALTPRQQYKGYVLAEKGKKGEAWYIDLRTTKRTCFRVTSEVDAALMLLRVKRAVVSARVLAAIPIAKTCRKPKAVVTLPIRGSTEPVIVMPENPKPSATQPTQPPEIPQPPPSTSSGNTLDTATLAQLVRDVFDRINARRRSIGVSELRINATLTAVAEVHAADMQARDYISGTTPEGKTIFALLRDRGYDSALVSAFYAQGYTSAQAVVDQWLARRTPPPIDTKEFQDIGIGFVGASGDKPITWVILIAESTTQALARLLADIAQTLSDRTAVLNEVLVRTNAARAACASSNDHPLPRSDTDCPDHPEPECSAPLPPLVLNPMLMMAAQAHADDMKARRFINHVNPEGEQPWDRGKKAGYQYRAYGENLACGPDTAKDVVEGWLKSCGHRAAILSPDYTEIGLGLAIADDTETLEGRANHPCDLPIYWAQNFGKPK